MTQETDIATTISLDGAAVRLHLGVVSARLSPAGARLLSHALIRTAREAERRAEAWEELP